MTTLLYCCVAAAWIVLIGTAFVKNWHQIDWDDAKRKPGDW